MFSLRENMQFRTIHDRRNECGSTLMQNKKRTIVIRNALIFFLHYSLCIHRPSTLPRKPSTHTHTHTRTYGLGCFRRSAVCINCFQRDAGEASCFPSVIVSQHFTPPAAAGTTTQVDLPTCKDGGVTFSTTFPHLCLNVYVPDLCILQTERRALLPQYYSSPRIGSLARKNYFFRRTSRNREKYLFNICSFLPSSPHPWLLLEC